MVVLHHNTKKSKNDIIKFVITFPTRVLGGYENESVGKIFFARITNKVFRKRVYG